jgi:CRISPR/Cas system CSM-associated protein Csm2 small subunit
VQYECIKTELKEEYEKRVSFLHKRIEKRQAQQGPYQDAHLILMQNSMGELLSEKQDSKNRKDNNSPKKGEFHLPGMK